MKAPTACLALLLATLAGGPAAAGEPAEGGLTLMVVIEGIEPRTGTVRCALFDSPDSYLRRASRSAVLEVDRQRRRLVWRIEGLAPGRYAVALHHDVNGNGENDRNLLGIPREPYAFSRGARARFGPPPWKRVAFAIDGAETRIELVVR